MTGVTHNGDGGALQAEVLPGNIVAYGLAGSSEGGAAFGVLRDAASDVDVFKTLTTLSDDVASNPAGISADLQNLTHCMDHLSLASGKLGGVQNRLSHKQTLIQNLSDGLGQTISNLSDTDIAATVTKLKSLEVAYQASLSVGAKVGDLSPLNNLR